MLHETKYLQMCGSICQSSNYRSQRCNTFLLAHVVSNQNSQLSNALST